MLAPIDKLMAGGNRIIQIVVTRRCTLNCSNCTQLLPFRRDVPNMSLAVFRAALRSLAGWPGVRGVFGGNPPCHPQFQQIMQILVEEVPEQKQRGLWANDLLDHGELVREVFFPGGYTNLNAHGDAAAAAKIDRFMPGHLITQSRTEPSWHGSILVDRREYGIADEKWSAMREACDINRNWSAAIVERDGAPFVYFCEVASSLDGVRGENAGIPAEPGWWKWPMARFEHQVRSCCDRGCGVPLRLKGHLDRDDTYDVSPGWSEAVGVRRKTVALQVHDALPLERSHELTDYVGLRAPRRAR